MEKIKTNLLPYGIEFENLCKLLIDTKSFISGSFVLKAIETTDTTWNSSDIDIFTSHANLEIFEKFLIEHGYLRDDTIHTYKYYIVPNDLKNIVNGCQTYINGSKKIQIIMNNSESMLDPEAYVRKFDISICSNYFDGQNIHCLFQDDISNKKFTVTIFCSRPRR